jgi:predicted phosphodiesterase
MDYPMNYLTIFSDIHANLPALEAVIADMDQRGLGNRYCLGDLVGYGTFPNEVVAVIRNSKIPTIMGNYDQGVGNSKDDCGCAYKDEIAKALGQRSIAWTNEHTTDENKTFLRQLPQQNPLPLGDLNVLLVHGSPAGLMNTYTRSTR